MSSLYLLREGAGPVVTALGSTYRTKTDGSQVNDAYALVEEQFWGETTPLHRHLDAEEAFYVLDGEVEVWVDGATSAATRGAFLVVPRGVTHGLRRVSEEPVLMLTLVSPPGFEKVFEAVMQEGEEDLLAEPARLMDLRPATAPRSSATTRRGEHELSHDHTAEASTASSTCTRCRPAAAASVGTGVACPVADGG